MIAGQLRRIQGIADENKKYDIVARIALQGIL
jgi:hypothetical protein